MSRKIVLLSVLSLGLCALPAFAGDFDADGATVWAARVNGFVDSFQNVGAMPENPKPEDFRPAFRAMKQSCEGLTGENMKYGSHMPLWASQAESEYCSGVNVFAMNPHAAGKPLRAAVKTFSKADPAKDPPEVVAAAGRMVEYLTLLVGKK